MKISIVKKNQITAPGIPNSMFPGAALTKDGKILLLHHSGSAFESSDCRAYKAWSTDLGESWVPDGSLHEVEDNPFDLPYAPCMKPTVLENGDILAVGYGFLRDKPEMGLSDYAEKYGHLPEVKNVALRSHDNGKTWGKMEVIEHDFRGLELSGPAVNGLDGKLHFFAAPFVLGGQAQTGLSYESSDQGRTWQQTGTFFESPDIAPWEIRGIQLPCGRIVLVLWLYDLKAQKHCNTHIVWSDDFGGTWSKPFDTGLRGQASNMLLYRDELYLLQARREEKDPGLFLNKVTFEKDGSIFIGEDHCLWDAAGLANQGKRIEQQFASLRFGQPSALKLKDGEYILFFWRCAEEIYSIQAWKFTLQE